MARSRKHEKNLANVQDMLDGNYNKKIKIGTHNPKSVHEGRKVGDKWEDSDGVEWEQREGYRSKIGTTPNRGIFSKVCSDCDTPCKTNIDVETYHRMSRCYYCQINFEAKLKSKIIGSKNSKHFFWVKLKQLQRWIAMDLESEQMWLENFDRKVYDKSVSNAMANDNILKAREDAKFNK